jgi:hypothetical protein
MKQYFLTLLLFLSYSGFGQIQPTKINSTKLPKQVSYTGHITNAVTWKDEAETHYVLTTETGEYLTKDKYGDEMRNAALYVYHYVLKDKSAHLLWRIYDFSKDCPFDLSVKFLNNTFSITDLDKNGVAEIWVMYENQCTSDVSPSPTKIIMYEGVKKYAIRGEGRVRISAKAFIGGSYVLDENFKNGNEAFRKYAITIWEKNKMKRW